MSDEQQNSTADENRRLDQSQKSREWDLGAIQATFLERPDVHKDARDELQVAIADAYEMGWRDGDKETAHPTHAQQLRDLVSDIERADAAAGRPVQVGLHAAAMLDGAADELERLGRLRELAMTMLALLKTPGFYDKNPRIKRVAAHMHKVIFDGQPVEGS